MKEANQIPASSRFPAFAVREDFPNEGRSPFVSYMKTKAQNFMRRSVVVWVMLACALAGEARAEQGATTFYVQLIRGTETTQPPVPGCKPVGPRLARTFRPVFKWKGYWEMNRQQVALGPRQTSRVRLGNGREAEIDLRNPKQRRIAAFQNGQLVGRTISPPGETMTIIGENRDGKSVWFIVVRRDKPGDSAALRAV
jgi:hypothetical protein